MIPGAEANQVGGIDLSALDAGFANSPLGQTLSGVNSAQSAFDVSSLIHSLSSDPNKIMQETQGNNQSGPTIQPGQNSLQMAGTQLIGSLIGNTGGAVQKSDLASGNDLSNNSKIEGDQQKLAQGEIPDKKNKNGGNDKTDKFMKIVDAGMKIWNFLSKIQ